MRPAPFSRDAEAMWTVLGIRSDVSDSFLITTDPQFRIVMPMDISDADRIKHRQIPFNDLHPHSDQAQQAALFLAGVPGITHVEPDSPLLLSVRYDLLLITLEEIEESLRELGLHLDNNLLYRVKSALYRFTEETFRANCGCPRGESNCTKKVFAKRYELLDHTLRDQRPEHWRRYL